MEKSNIFATSRPRNTESYFRSGILCLAPDYISKTTKPVPELQTRNSLGKRLAITSAFTYNFNMQALFFYPEKNELNADISEIQRYLGYKKDSRIPESVKSLIEKSALEMQKLLTPKACYKEFDLTVVEMTESNRKERENLQAAEKKGDSARSAGDNSADTSAKLPEYQISFADLNFISKNLGINLKNCSKVILFGLTIGPLVDQKIRKAQLSGSTEAAIFQATGAMYAEGLTELLNKKIKEEYLSKGYKAHPRYSPGYGDISLEMQKDFFRLLPLEKIGLTLMESLIMAPEKSVTAFIGLEKI